jgi:hypothetical protein
MEWLLALQSKIGYFLRKVAILHASGNTRGVIAYRVTPLQVETLARALALRVLADRMENEVSIPFCYNRFFCSFLPS